MKVCRGPAGKPMGDDSHELVDEVDLAEALQPWVDQATFRVSVTKLGPERRAVSHLSFTPADVQALRASLTAGLLLEVADLRRRLAASEDLPAQLKLMLTLFAFRAKSATPDNAMSLLAEVTQRACRVLDASSLVRRRDREAIAGSES
jgi:hypothetical protein